MIKGEFNEKALPAEPVLLLKVGAQIMFIKNDKGEARRYYNGKIGTISKIDGDDIYVKFADNTDELKIELETWTNIRYNYNQEQDRIEEEELGSFVQYPIRLAWAITIHKSQGLTFEKAIIDAGDSFAAGQVYVALSRLTSLEGLILYSRINRSAIDTDKRVIAFTEKELDPQKLEEILIKEQAQYLFNTLIHTYDWSKIVDDLKAHFEGFANRQLAMQNEAIAVFSEVVQKIKAQEDVAKKFTSMLADLLPIAAQDNYAFTQSRIHSASNYFLKAIDEEILNPITAHFDDMKNRSRVIKYVGELRKLIKTIQRKKTQLEHGVYIINNLAQGIDANALLAQIEEENKLKSVAKISPLPPKEKVPKGETQRISLAMFKAGKTIAEIAIERGMVEGTISSHLDSFIETGEIKAKELVDEQKFDTILELINLNPDKTNTEIKEMLGEDFTWNELRTVRTHFKLTDLG
ncbi:MAG: hypothetical protein RL308_3134 [Bacteroidota bacterium]